VRIILLGAPGSGKGTQAGVLSEKFGIPVISTGNILREEIAQASDIGRAAKAIIDSWQLVPDEVVIEIVRKRLSRPDCAAGFILDGFPRTIAQAESLEKLTDVDCALSLEVSDGEIERRMSGRRVCPRCGASFHLLYNPPKSEGVCSECGEKLIQRSDDAEQTVRARLAQYHAKTEPLKGFYEARGKLRLVAGREKVEDTTRATLEALGV